MDRFLDGGERRPGRIERLVRRRPDVTPTRSLLDLDGLSGLDVEDCTHAKRQRDVRIDVSKDAMARAYAEYHSAPIAFVVVRDGKVGATYRNRARFPFITALRGKPVPERSLFYRKGLRPGVPSDIDARLPDNWIDVERGRPAPMMSEQVYLQANGFALIMLWYEPPEDPDFDEDGERTSKERLKLRQARFS